MIYNPKLDIIPYKYADIVIDEIDFHIINVTPKPDFPSKINVDEEKPLSPKPTGKNKNQ